MNYILYVFLIALILLLVLTIWNTRICAHWQLRQIPFIKPAHFLSRHFLNSIFITQSRLASMYKQAEHQNFIGFFQLRNPVLMIRCPHLANVVLQKEFESFSSTRSEVAVNEKKDPLSQNLLSLSGLKWRSLRKRMAHLFAPHNMKCYLKYVNNHANCFVDGVKNNGNDSFVDVTKLSHAFSVGTILSCIMGENVEQDDLKKLHPVLEEKSLQAGFWPFFWWNIKLAYPRFFRLLQRSGYNEKVKDFFLNHLKNSIENEMKEDFSLKTGFLRQLIRFKDLKDSVSHNDFMNIICAQVYTLYVGGTDSITTTLSCTIYELAKHPDVFKTVREEVMAVAALHGSFSYTALMKLSYLERVIKETMRLHPPGYSITRRCTKTIRLPEFGITIDKGTDLVIPVLEFHKDPKYFENPVDFNPSRFTETNSMKITTGSYLPFGDGPRRCIGIPLSLLEIKMVIAKLCVAFQKIKLNDSQREILETEELSRVYTLKNNLYVKFINNDSVI